MANSSSSLIQHDLHNIPQLHRPPQIPTQIRRIPLQIHLRQPTPIKLEAIRTPISNLEILRPDPLQQTPEMHHTPRVDGGYPRPIFVATALFVPRLAIAVPCGAAEDLLDVDVEGLDGALGGADGGDVFGGDFMGPLEDVTNDVFEGGED